MLNESFDRLKLLSLLCRNAFRVNKEKGGNTKYAKHGLLCNADKASDKQPSMFTRVDR